MNRIYVFSGTGTSLQVAKDLAAGLNDVEIVSMPKLMKSGDWEIVGEKVGFVFPCYYGEAPQLIKTFIEEAKRIDYKYSFGIATAGGDIGYSLKKLDEYLSGKGKKLNYGRSIIIASNYMNGWYYDMILPKPDDIKNNIIKSKELCTKFASDILNESNDIEKPNYLRYKIPHIISPKRYLVDTRPWDTEYSVSDECNGCSICSKVCPVDNITMSGSKPEFRHNCTRCMACIQYCPKSAFVIENKPMDKTKFTHPEISLSEIIEFNN